MKEEWKNIEVNINYQVSNLGRVKNNNHLNLFKERFMTPCDRGNGYMVVRINNKLIHVHRLVALSFIPNPENKPYVNHKDGIRYNNCVNNLEWNTPKENDHHASINGLKASGERNGYSRLTESIVSEIRSKYIPRKYTNRMLAKEYGMSYHEIQLINQGKRWSCPKSILT